MRLILLGLEYYNLVDTMSDFLFTLYHGFSLKKKKKMVRTLPNTLWWLQLIAKHSLIRIMLYRLLLQRLLWPFPNFILLLGSIQDYVLLEKLNKLTITKYSEMSDTAKTLITVMEELDKKCKFFSAKISNFFMT